MLPILKIIFFVLSAVPMSVHAVVNENTTCPKIVHQNARTSQTNLADFTRLRALQNGRPTLFVAHGISSGVNYAPRTKELFPHVNLVHVRTADMTPQLIGMIHPSDYDLEILYTPETLAELEKEVRPLLPSGVHVVAGAESAIEARAQLTDAFNVPGSSLDLAHSRIHKYSMARVVSPYVNTIPGEVFSSEKAALDWAANGEFSYPLIVKPANASGSFGVKEVKNDAQLRSAVRYCFRNKKNPMGKQTLEILIQPSIPRWAYDEYVFNAVVNNGVASVSDVLVYKKQIRNGNVNYLTTRLVHPQRAPALYAEADRVATGVAKGFGVKNGLLHIEVFMRLVNGKWETLFIEAGERAAGGGLPLLVRAAGGDDMITLHLYSLFAPELYAEKIKSGPVFSQDAMQIELLGPSFQGIVQSIPAEEEFRNRIPAFHRHILHFERNAVLGPSQDLFKDSGVIEVVGSDSQMDSAEQAVRQWEQNGFYDIRPLTPFQLLKEAWTQWLGN